MPKIGKAIFVSGGMHFAFALTINGNTYTFDEKSASSEVANVYKYDRVKEGNVDKWALFIYASGTITFSKLKHLVDYCAVGGGGGGGGGSCGGSGQYGSHGVYGGSGGGGRYAELKSKMLSLNNAYTLTIGAGANGGIPGGGGGAIGANGAAGSATSFGSLLTANGGDGGGAGWDAAGRPGTNSDEKTAVHCFGDESFPEVSGNSAAGKDPTLRGAGGGGGIWGISGADPYATRGKTGANGLIVIRSTPKS